MTKEVSLKEYIMAMEVVHSYENTLKGNGNGSEVCRCEKCGLKAVYDIKKARRTTNAGTDYYYAVCPYCNEETFLMKY